MKVRQPPDCTGNEPKADIPIGALGRTYKIKNYQHMPPVINMLIMNHVHHLSREMEWKNLYFVLKYTPTYINPTSPTT